MSAAVSPARWWHTTTGPDGQPKVVCTLCPRECHIPEGSRGFCFVRANVDGRLVLTTHGRSSGFCIDPIEKKPLFHFLPGTGVLSLGTAGCNLGCKFCQNWDISRSRQFDRLTERADPGPIVQAAIAAGCRSIALTYNDPIIWAEYALDIAREARGRGVHTVAVTSGYISPRARAEFFDLMDAANVDLKAFSDDFYRRLCQARLQPVLDTLEYLARAGRTWLEITTLLIPGQNDSDAQLAAMCDWLLEHVGPDVPLHFTAFHPDYQMLDTPPTPPDTLRRARSIALGRGLRYVYVGNVHSPQEESTRCPGCGALLVERDWHELGRFGLRDGRCAACGRAIPGVFDPGSTPGHWGRRRLPIRIGHPAAQEE